MTQQINVTKTFLPSQDSYHQILKKAWNSYWLTNRGQLVLELEQKISQKLNTNQIIATTNGTLPLQIAIKALELKGEIITTPFSYVATTSSIIWENCKPVFVDIDPQHLTIDESQIISKITKNTTAIIATHVFGNPCNIEAIEQIAETYNLNIIYDAAHCFGVKYMNKSIFNYGDISTCSFHATKIFHTGEGGAIFTNNINLYEKLFYHHNFGHNGSEQFHGLGTNAKMNEMQAAMGLAVLPHFEDILTRRKLLYNIYLDLLSDNKSLKFQKIRENTDYNHSYFPVIFKSESQLLKVREALNNNNIFPRRYFYPSLNNLPYIENRVKMTISESIASRILCLPLYFDLSEKNVVTISKIILNYL